MKRSIAWSALLVVAAVRLSALDSDIGWKAVAPPALSGPDNGTVWSSAFGSDGSYYVGGSFTDVGGRPMAGIARWDGTAWQPLGTGIAGTVYIIRTVGNDVYAGGAFTTAGGVTVNGIARWNGSEWSGFGGGVRNGSGPGEVAGLAIDPAGRLYVGGGFTHAGGVATRCIARWDGSAWTTWGGAGTGGEAASNGLPFVEKVDRDPISGEVFICGHFSTVGGLSARKIARWNGTAWSALGTGLSFVSLGGVAWHMQLLGNGRLYVGGAFFRAGGAPASGIAYWDGGRWSPLGSGVPVVSTPGLRGVGSLSLNRRGELIVGGIFAEAGGVPVGHIATWDGARWSALGSGITATTTGSWHVSTIMHDPQDNIWVGGALLGAGGKPAKRVAIYDVPPRVAVTAPSPSNAERIAFTLIFSEPVSSPDAARLSVTNGAVVDITGSGTTWTVSVSPSQDGVVFLDVQDSFVRDSAGHGNFAARGSSVNDRSAPTAAVTPNGITTASSPIVFALTFSEPCPTFVAATDVVVTGGTWTASGAGMAWTVTVEPANDGLVRVHLPSGACEDAAGNACAGATAEVISDRYLPRLGITPDAIATNDDPIAFTLQFSESMTGFDVTDLVVAGGAATLSSDDGGEGRRWIARVAPQRDGPVTLGVATGSCLDLAGNPIAATSVTVTSDRTSPTPTLAPDGDTTSVSPIIYTIRFDEVVHGVTRGDLTVGNGSVSDLALVDDAWSVAVVPAADGLVTLRIAAGAAADAAGNASRPGSATRRYVGDSGHVVISPDGGATNAMPIGFLLSFDRPVVGLTTDDLEIVGGAGSLTGGGAAWALAVTPTGDGLVRVTLPDGACSDETGTPIIGGSAAVISDRTAPVIELRPPGGLTNEARIRFTLESNEALIGFTTEDVTVSGRAYDLREGDGRHWHIDVVPTADGPVIVAIAAGSASDAAGNAIEAASATMHSDRTAPRIFISPSDGVSNATEISFDLTLDEEVIGFDAQDITSFGGDAMVTGSGTAWRVVLRSEDDGEVGVEVASGSASDAAGNPLVGARARVRRDTKPPSARIEPREIATNQDPIEFMVELSEDVGDFDDEDIAVTGGTYTIAGTGTRRTVRVSPGADGPIQVSVSGTTDAAGNPMTVSSGAVLSDRTPPIPTTDADTAVEAPCHFPIHCDEPFVFDPHAGITVSGGRLLGVVGNELIIWPTNPSGGRIGVWLPPGTLGDAAGNGSPGTALDLWFAPGGSDGDADLGDLDELVDEADCYPLSCPVCVQCP